MRPALPCATNEGTHHAKVARDHGRGAAAGAHIGERVQRRDGNLLLQSDNAYGWCAGYSYARGETCAKGQCEKYGNDCFLALECDGGYAATAFAVDPASGFGASCQYDGANSARAMALFACITASHALCGTSEVFTNNGNVASQSENKTFDRTLNGQMLLIIASYDPGGAADGIPGAKTRAAVKAFQSDLGLDQSGELTDEVFDLLTYAVAGTHMLIDGITRDTKTLESIESSTFRFAGKVADPLTFTAELGSRGDTDRRQALAAVMTVNGTRCTLPAHSAEVVDEAAEAWTASCDEGDFDVSFGGGVTITPHQDQKPPVIDDSKKSPGHPVTHRTFAGAAALFAPKSGGATNSPHEGGGKG